MLKIGLTGGIGSGKSTVASIFKVLEIPVFDADQSAKLIMEKDEHLILSIRKLLGKESYKNNKPDKLFIAQVVFNDPDKLKQLNALVHPATIAAAYKWMDEQIAPYAVKEAALLLEAGSAKDLDYVVGVHAPEPLRIKRVMKRDQLTEEQVLARIKQQMNEEEKMKLCDFVVINDEQQLLIPQVVRLHEKFINEEYLTT